MRIVNAEHLIPKAEEIQKLLQKAYDAGRTRGREEAKREQQGLAEPPDDADREAGEAGGVSAVRSGGTSSDGKCTFR